MFTLPDDRYPAPESAGPPVDALIDGALASYPVAPLPAGFTARTMARVQAAPAVPRPRLAFLDLALPAFVAVSALAVLLLAAGAGSAEPALGPTLAAYSQAVQSALLPGIAVPWLAVVTYGSAAAGVAALLAVLVLDRARGVARAG